MRLKLTSVAVVALAACQSEVPTVAAPEGASKVSTIPVVETCRQSKTPRCEFRNREDAAAEQLLGDLFAICTPAGTDSAYVPCLKHGLWESLQTSAAARDACSSEDFTVFLLCITTLAQTYDIAVHAGWEYARAFDWNGIGAEKEAMRAIKARSMDACDAANIAESEHCYREALAEQLGVPEEDAFACAAAGEQSEVEHCLLSAHGFRFMKAAADRFRSSVRQTLASSF